ncbi:hypothetical protein DPEC_G00288940 [Dallia pectoralis]|uniref:Uncharacterized protein n=1 Tax=Dallia pectoralis TaxID=75939 RepID=A0ACC2FKP1_DALPE|nr:hypothetical protein DPEC_G00288940 [Dallia pectoralis]
MSQCSLHTVHSVLSTFMFTCCIFNSVSICTISTPHSGLVCLWRLHYIFLSPLDVFCIHLWLLWRNFALFSPLMEICKYYFQLRCRTKNHNHHSGYIPEHTQTQTHKHTHSLFCALEIAQMKV